MNDKQVNIKDELRKAKDELRKIHNGNTSKEIVDAIKDRINEDEIGEDQVASPYSNIEESVNL